MNIPAKYHNEMKKLGLEKDPLAFIQIHFLDSCVCGDPEASIGYVKSVLQYFRWMREEGRKTDYSNEWQRACAQKQSEIFRTQGIEYFTYYMLYNLDLTEHGGSVPGWLTEKGYELLEILESDR